ncbi:MAG: rhomboid family intramembrane serine protease [Verrucomicrobia bacterium]|nr:rhomboid family intramembrane serine protease [Verrucomicrobiota bacterium]MBU4497944.1 rhomboid family intramembrane serine protease [Verrucomicrobiota bacterium]
MGGTLTPAVRFFLIFTGAVFVLQWALQATSSDTFTLMFSLSPVGIRHGFIWQLATYMFLHSGFWHILLNMAGLFFFGPATERAIGMRRFVALYLVSGILGGIGWLLLTGNQAGFCLGASGAVFGVLGAFAALFPDRPITLLVFFVLPVTMRARTMAIGLGLFSLLAMITQPGNIAYSAHLAGGLAGYGYIQWFFNRRGLSAALWNPRKWFSGVWRAINDLRWHWYRRKFKVITSPSSGGEEERKPSQEEVDAILEKISKWGVGHLTRQEREILDRASGRRK